MECSWTKFHDENTYFICLEGETLIGMVAGRANRPISLDHKLSDLDSYLPNVESICEIRLLAVDKERRGGRVLKGLLTMLADYCIQNGHALAIISGTMTQQKLYRRLGSSLLAQP